MKLSEKATTSLQRVIEKFQAGDLSSITSILRIKLPDDAPARKWSFRNKILAYAQAGHLDCRGYKQWQEFGRQVSPGPGAVYILGPRMIKVTDEQTGKETMECRGFVSIPVFSPEETEGDTPLPSYAPAEPPPLMNVAVKLGMQVEYMPVAPDRLGDFTGAKNRIRLGTTDPAVWFHELAHKAHHATDEDYRLLGTEEKEVVAEFTACVLADLYGYDRTGNSWAYIAHYAPDDPLQAVYDALGKIEPVIAFIMSLADDQEAEPVAEELVAA